MSVSVIHAREMPLALILMVPISAYVILGSDAFSSEALDVIFVSKLHPKGPLTFSKTQNKTLSVNS